MDARTVTQIAGVKLGTLNSWAQQGLIPGMTIAVSGRRRNIDVPTATRIAVVSALVRLGFGAPAAANIVRQLSGDPFPKRLVFTSIQPGAADRRGMHRRGNG